MNWSHAAYRLLFFSLRPAAWAVHKYHTLQEQRRLDLEADREIKRTKQELMEKYYGDWDR